MYDFIQVSHTQQIGTLRNYRKQFVFIQKLLDV